jgi:hypothetical protein
VDALLAQSERPAVGAHLCAVAKIDAGLTRQTVAVARAQSRAAVLPIEGEDAFVVDAAAAIIVDKTGSARRTHCLRSGVDAHIAVGTIGAAKRAGLRTRTRIGAVYGGGIREAEGGCTMTTSETFATVGCDTGLARSCAADEPSRCAPELSNEKRAILLAGARGIAA